MARKETAPDAAGANRRFIYLLNLAQRRLQQWTQSVEAGLTSSQSGVLFQLDSNQGVLIGEVARNLGIGPSGISGLVDRMEGAGLVRRVPDEADGRAVRLVLTEQGRAAREVAKRMVATINARLSQGFSDSELTVVARWLTHVSDSFKKEPDDE